MGPTAGLIILRKREISCPFQESKPGYRLGCPNSQIRLEFTRNIDISNMIKGSIKLAVWRSRIWICGHHAIVTWQGSSLIMVMNIS
jgi:hypothetical protein